MKKITALLLALTMSLALLGACGNSGNSTKTDEPAAESSASEETSGDTASSEAKDLKVGAIFAGAINDGSWNETQYNGLKRIEAQGASISYMENVSDTDAAEAARTYAAEGYNLVYLSTNSFQDHCTPIAAEYPDTIFIQINGTEITDNFISVSVADEEQGFMQGVAAALMSESGKVGFVGGLEITPIILGSSGFQQGVDYANETYGLSVEAQRINTGSFTDVNQAKETAISLIESGCDVMAPMADDASVGIMEAAEEKSVKAVGSGISLVASAPTMTQVVIVKDISLTYDATFAEFLKGELHPTAVTIYGAKEGIVSISDWKSDIDAEIKSKVEETFSKLANGEIKIDTNV